MKTETTQETAVPEIENMYCVLKIKPSHGIVDVRGYIRKGQDEDSKDLLAFKGNLITVYAPGVIARWFGDTMEKRIRWATGEMRRRTFREIRKRHKEKERDERLKQMMQRMGLADEDSSGA